MDSVVKSYWTVSRCGRAVFVAAPFGYGPRIAAETLARRLKLELTEWDQCSVPNKPGYRVLLNFGSANTPRFESVFSVWIDCLAWVRKVWPSIVRDYDLILAEAFFLGDYTTDTPKGLTYIAPLLNLDCCTACDNPLRPKDYLLLSFGGIETPFTQDAERSVLPLLILRALVKSLRRNRSDRRIVCCIPDELRQHLSVLPDMATVLFLSPDHSHFIDLLKYAAFYIVQPGLYGPFEAFQLNVPTVFCTPFSYTQVLQARKYEERGLLGYVPLWSEINEFVGPLQADVEREEPTCFKRIGMWFNRRSIQNDLHAVIDEWADMIVFDSGVPEELTAKRHEHVASSNHFSEKHLLEISNVLNGAP